MAEPVLFYYYLKRKILYMHFKNHIRSIKANRGIEWSFEIPTDCGCVGVEY